MDTSMGNLIFLLFSSEKIYLKDGRIWENLDRKREISMESECLWVWVI